MGHLTRIANMVVQNLEKGPVHNQITDLIKGKADTAAGLMLKMSQEVELTEKLVKLNVPGLAELPEDCRGRWESFVDETLRETNRRNTVELVRCHSCMQSFLVTPPCFLLSQFDPVVFTVASLSGVERAEQRSAVSEQMLQLPP